MVWSKYPTSEDVKLAFAHVTHILNASHQPMYVIVDIRSNPKFPFASTLQGASFGPQISANFLGWLVIGTSLTARFIDHTLASMTGKFLVHWFQTEEQAASFIDQSADHSACQV